MIASTKEIVYLPCKNQVIPVAHDDIAYIKVIKIELDDRDYYSLAVYRNIKHGGKFETDSIPYGQLIETRGKCGVFDTIFPPEQYYRMEDGSYHGAAYFVNSSRIKSVTEWQINFDCVIDSCFSKDYLPSDYFAVWDGPDFPKETVGTMYSLPYYMKNISPEKWKGSV